LFKPESGLNRNVKYSNKKNARKVRVFQMGPFAKGVRKREGGGSEMAAEEFYHTDAVKTKNRGRPNYQLRETCNTFFCTQFPRKTVRF
jgi:hypothetical protein